MSGPGIASGFTDQGSNSFENLIAGDFPRISRKVTIQAGADLVAGSVLGQIAANSKYIVSLSAAGDGSETPTAILAEDAAAASADVEALIWETGDFNESALTVGTGHTIASIRAGLRALSIHFHKNLAE